LTPNEIAVLEAWAEADAPGGDPKDMPPPPQFGADWKLCRPDLILEPADDFSLTASGPDTYRCFVIPTQLGARRLCLGHRLSVTKLARRTSYQCVH
jgi:hypothetical protein